MTTVFSWLNPFAYSPFFYSGTACKAPEKDPIPQIRAKIQNPKFIHVTENEIVTALKRLRPVAPFPPAPKIPVYLLAAPTLKDQIQQFCDMTHDEMFETLSKNK